MSSNRCQSVIDPRPMPNRVLVLGATGMVGRSWMECLRAQHIECTGLSRPEFDLMNPESIARCIPEGYDLVVNASAWTDVDGAESDEARAIRANGEAIAEIARLCARQSTTLITYSTDYVFSGNESTPYPVDAPIQPINAYGRSKAIGESKLLQSGADHILIRTSWVYAPWGTNFVRTILNLSQSRDELSVVNDQRGRPTSAQHLAQRSLDLYLNGAKGIWHLTDNDECTWFDLAREITLQSGLACTVHPCSSELYPRPAARPFYSTLDIQSTQRLIGPIGDWRSHLKAVLGSITKDSIASES